jgi:hypothetical protein
VRDKLELPVLLVLSDLEDEGGETGGGVPVIFTAGDLVGDEGNSLKKGGWGGRCNEIDDRDAGRLELNIVVTSGRGGWVNTKSSKSLSSSGLATTNGRRRRRLKESVPSEALSSSFEKERSFGDPGGVMTTIGGPSF